MLGRYTTGPVAARAEHSRGAPGCPPCQRQSQGAGPHRERQAGRRAAGRNDVSTYTRAMSPIDLRSDTVTHPSPAQRGAMADAELGDDVFGDDPTTIALEERAAELLGKEAGLFVASGTMGNLVAQMAHLSRGEETIAGREHHIVIDEAAGHAVIVGTSIRALDDRPDGTMALAAIEEAFRDPSDLHEPISGLVTIENTHAHSMGQPLTPAYTREVADIAHAHGVPLHLDGARFWNAVVALEVAPTELSGPPDTGSFCLS